MATLKSLEDRLITHEEKLDGVAEGVAILLSHVVGNGHPGLIRRVSALEGSTNKAKGAIMLAMALGPLLGVALARLTN